MTPEEKERLREVLSQRIGVPENTLLQDFLLCCLVGDFGDTAARGCAQLLCAEADKNHGGSLIH